MPPLQPPAKRRHVAPSADVGWYTFDHQAAALEFAEVHQTIWAREKNGNGARSYIVATREDFWRRYKTLKREFRHYYELIRAESPCQLYFDVEYCKHANPEADGEEMVCTLVDELKKALAALPELQSPSAGSDSSDATITGAADGGSHQADCGDGHGSDCDSGTATGRSGDMQREQSRTQGRSDDPRNRRPQPERSREALHVWDNTPRGTGHTRFIEL